MLEVRYVYDHGLRFVDGTEVWCDELGEFGAPASLVAPVSLTSIRHALIRHADVWGAGDAELWVSPDDSFEFDDETSDTLGYRLVARDGDLMLGVDVDSRLRLSADELVGAVAPVVGRHGSSIVGVWEVDWRGTTCRRIMVRMPVVRRVAETAFRLGDAVLLSLDLRLRPAVDAPSVMRVLESGQWELLCDLEEKSWLDAKSRHYRTDERGKLDLASDVASFCNSDGGIIVIGAKTKHTPDGDRVVAVNQCPLPAGIVRRYEQTLRQRIVPAPVGVRVIPFHNAVDRSRGMLVIEIPRQPIELGPWLVGGALVGASIHGTMVGLPVRRGADTDWAHISALQERLRATRVAVRD